MDKDMSDSQPAIDLMAKAKWVRRETLLIHQRAPETRLASSLSLVEVLIALFYGGILRFDPRNPSWEQRDRLIISKGHGSIAMYPILADLGFFKQSELLRVCQDGSFLGGIPDPIIPGYETVNGSLGHGLGVACGMALALKKKGNDSRVVAITGDGEMHEGSVWEAIMFAGHHQLSNLLLIVDDNKRCILGDTAQVINLKPLAGKLSEFGWATAEVPGHDVYALCRQLQELMESPDRRPKALVADTQKGHGVSQLEADPLSHVRTLGAEEVDRAIRELDNEC